MKFIKLEKVFEGTPFEVKSPSIAYKSDAGIDVYAPCNNIIKSGETKQIKLGISIEIEEDEVAIMSERSGMAIKYNIHSIGNIIDSGYRGEISIILQNNGKEDFIIKEGDKIGQIIILKLGNREVIEVKELSETERGNKAHYSSGK